MTGRKYGKEIATVWLSGERPNTPEQSLSELMPAMDKLLQHFKIEDHNWPLLAFRLAVEGGFIRYKGEDQKPGREQRWTDRELVRLWATVELAKSRNPRRTDTAVCKELAPTWGASGLRQQLYKAKRLTVTTSLAALISGVDATARNRALEVLAE